MKEALASLFFGIRYGNTFDVQSPVGHSARSSPEEGIVLAFVARRLETLGHEFELNEIALSNGHGPGHRYAG